MGTNLRIALFVEGSSGPAGRRIDGLKRLWLDVLVKRLGLLPINRLVPINKRNIARMEPDAPRCSGCDDSLDVLIARELRRDTFDAVVLAWDLLPPWLDGVDTEEEPCRWQETVRLYRHLSMSNELPAEWKEEAERRLVELEGRPSPSTRIGPMRPRHNTITPICMEPDFESVLAQDEAALRRALGIEGQRVERWPPWPHRTSHTWRRNKADGLIGKAIEAVRHPRVKNPPRVCSQFLGWRENKSEWGAYLLEALLQDGRSRCREHALIQRLVEVLGA